MIECADSSGNIRGFLLDKSERRKQMVSELEKWVKEFRETAGRGQNYIYITEREALEIIELLRQ